MECQGLMFHSFLYVKIINSLSCYGQINYINIEKGF